MGEDALDRVLERQLTALGAQRSALDKSLRVCRELRDAHVNYRDLPAQKYLDSFDLEPRAAVAEADRLHKVQAPVRRRTGPAPTCPGSCPRRGAAAAL